MSTYADALRSQAAELIALADLMEQELGAQVDGSVDDRCIVDHGGRCSIIDTGRGYCLYRPYAGADWQVTTIRDTAEAEVSRVDEAPANPSGSASADTATIATLDGLKTYDPRKDKTRGDPRRHDWTGMKPLTGPPPEVSDAATGSDNTQGWLKQLQDEVFALHGDLLSMQDYMDLTIRQEIEDRDLATKESLHQLARDLRTEFSNTVAAGVQEAVRRAVKIAKRDIQAESARRGPLTCPDYTR